MKRPTIAESILSDLRAARGEGNGWVCARHWLDSYRFTYAQRISCDLQPRGYLVERGPCPEEAHRHRGPVFRYRLSFDPDAQPVQEVMAWR